MRWRALLMVLVGVMLAGLIAAGQQGFSVSGRLSATEQEAQEGYFAVDSQTVIVVKPNSEFHAYLRARVGQRIRVTVEPERQSE